MSNEQYRKMKRKPEWALDKEQKEIVKAIRNPLTLFTGRYGETRWKNPVTDKDEPFDLYKICNDYGIDFSVFVRTQEQKEKDERVRTVRKDYLERKKENAKRIDDDRSSFIFVIWDGCVYSHHTGVAPEIMPETLTRLTLLAGCLKWEEPYIMRTNNIMDVDRKLCSKKARKRDIRKMLRLKPATFARFWMDATEHGYLEGNDVEGYRLAPMFYRGRLKGVHAQRIYIGPFREWYFRGCSQKSDLVDTHHHRRMGKVINLIPYVNREVNLLCKNHTENDEEKMLPLSGLEIAKIIGGCPYNWKRDLADLQKLMITVDQAEQTIMSENTQDADLPKGFYVNPNLIFFGKKEKFERLQQHSLFQKEKSFSEEAG